MTWKYQAKKVKKEFGDGYEYTVVDTFPHLQKKGDKLPQTESVRFFGETPEALADWLYIAAADILMYDVILDEDE